MIATTQSTLDTFIHVLGVPVLADHLLIQKVVKGAYNTRPPAPHYFVIWDTDILLQYLDSLENTCLDFTLLPCKTAILLTILSGQRVSTIPCILVPALPRWVKDMLHLSRIDTSHYAAHSCCAVSSPNTLLTIIFHLLHMA